MGKRRAAALGAVLFCACVSFAEAADDDAANPSPTKAVFNEAVKAYDAGNYAEAFKLFSSIDDTDLAAMRNVAFMLRKGLGLLYTKSIWTAPAP